MAFSYIPVRRRRWNVLLAAAISLFGVAVPMCTLKAGDRSNLDKAHKTKIVVFDFELRDNSAGGGIIAQDDRDTSYLRQSTDEAKRLLIESGRYSLVDTAGQTTRKFADCERCEAPLADKLGAEQAMIGLISRVNRTEYTLQIRIVDAQTGAPIYDKFTGLRLGANYAWLRGVTWLLKNHVLADEPSNQPGNR